MHHPALQQQQHPQHSNGAYHPQGQQRHRPSLQQAQSPIGLGWLGGGPGLGLSGHSGKSRLTFDHVLNRVQNESQKSRETGSERHSLASVMTDNQRECGGRSPGMCCYPQFLQIKHFLLFDPLRNQNFLRHQATSVPTSHHYRASLRRLSPRRRHTRTK